MYQTDAFTDKLFSGNPAAVCPLDKWLDDDFLQNIAMENNLSETAFYVKKGDEYEIRWFTPFTEVDLCGHATISAAFVLFHYENHPSELIRFYSPRAGRLIVSKNKDLLSLNFPADSLTKIFLKDEMKNAFGILPKEVYKGTTDFVYVFESEDVIRSLIPNLSFISAIDGEAIIATAKGDEVDFVSRYFAPQIGIDEDPVTGSAHTLLIPYWFGKLGKTSFQAIQLSKRKGFLQCRYLEDRVEISGKCCLYMIAELFV